MPTPIVSVLMSVHNGQDFLREAIESILNQTYRDFEFIVVDDASTDNSLNILKSFSDPRLKILEVEKNIGLVDALNLALKQAKGKYVARMDADDVSYPDRFAQQILRFKESPELVLLGCAFTYIDVNGRELSSGSPPSDNSTLQRDLIESGNPFCHPTVMMRTQDLKDIGGYRKIVNKFAQDYDLFLRLSERGEVANLKFPLLGYRIHSNQITVKKMKPQLFSAQVYRFLALQRRRGKQENLTKAIAEVSKQKKELNRSLVNGYLYWAAIMELSGNNMTAMYLRWGAVRKGPLRKDVYSMLYNQCLKYIQYARYSIGGID
jgi:glycosyltransferase involved in cell wall biosynthesis